MTHSTTISLIRHGDVHNPSDIVYGRRPRFKLSELGFEQARAAAQHFDGELLEALFSSPMLRARQTASAILANHPRLVLQQSGWLNEVYMPYEGWKREQMEARKWDVYTGTQPPYEQPSDIVARMVKFITQVRRRYSGHHVVAVTHGDPVLYFSLWANGLPVDFEYRSKLQTLGFVDSYPDKASITTVRYLTTEPDEKPLISYVRTSL